MLRIVISFVVAFAAAALGGKGLIPLLRRMKAGQSIKEIGPTWHMSKQGTPTMGGLMFIIGSAAAVLLLGWPDFAAGRFGGGFVLLFALVFGVIGYIDDYVKVKKHQNTGLTAPQKFLLQLAAAIVFTVLMRNHHYLTPDLYIPFVNVTLSLPWPVYMVFAAFVMVGTVNAVNITDGIDGLCSCVTFVSMLGFLTLVSFLGQFVMSILPAALAGALAGFLIWNFYPAKTFMGDTGSMFLGGAVAGLGYAMGRPEILFFFGAVYIWEAATVVIQVTYFKLTHGKRIFKMTPIHHSFEMRGWSEVKIDASFSALEALFVVLGLTFAYFYY